MGHFVGHMLPEPHLVWVAANFLQEQMYSCQEITKCFVVHNLFLHGLANRHGCDSGATGELNIAVEQIQLNVRNVLEFRVFLIVGVKEVLDLAHLEFAYTDETRPRRNLITEGLADGGRGEWHLAIVILEKLREV